MLHQIGRAVQGPLDSTTTDRRGRFRFGFLADSSALYLLSARYSGIEYFSSPVHTNPERPDTTIRIVVYDTSSAAPVRLAARHLVVTRPGEDGSRSVLDLLVLENDGRVTRIAPDSLHPSWTGPLLPGTIGLQLGEGDFSPDAVTRRNDSLILTGPLSPGERQLTVQYAVPSGPRTLSLPFDDAVASVNILTEERGVRVGGGPVAVADTQVIQGRSFRRWTASMPKGSMVTIVLPGSPRAPRWLLVALIVIMLLVLTGSGWRFVIRRPAALPVAVPEELVDTIARLDTRYAGRQHEVADAEWQFYRSERARLKAELEVSLAAGARDR